MNIRYDIDPALVKASVNKKIDEYKRHRISDKAAAVKTIANYKKTPRNFSAPRNEEYFAYIDPMYDDWIQCERTYYSKVRVIKIASRKYILVYGRRNDKTVKSGTGPFKTLRDAKAWFLNGGR